ncbi:MAG: FkbM family methyltransferase [Phycisphaerae bacterium]|nr:FkbM family methyltransferase [Phycisphaerae bacterium]
MPGAKEYAKTTVLDAGARYGMHPTWSSFCGELEYYAFEPDEKEAAYLRNLVPRPGFRVVCKALDRELGAKPFHITRHRGLCSFLRPDTASEWFKRYRPDAGTIEKTITVDATTIDEFARRNGLCFDFLKVDTEGTEQCVLEGGQEQIARNVLGIRTGVYFSGCYEGQSLISDTLEFLRERGFFMVNLDYFGLGTPRNSFFRKPDPVFPENHRYGVLISTDGVWLRDYNWVCKRFMDDAVAWEVATLKYASFCMLNHAPDVALDTLCDYRKRSEKDWQSSLVATTLFLGLRRACAEFLGRYRVCEDDMWTGARELFRNLFGIELEGGSGYWAQIRAL